MFEPITSQDQLNEVISSRLKREQLKINRRRADDLQKIIEMLDALSHLLKDMQDKWNSES